MQINADSRIHQLYIHGRIIRPGAENADKKTAYHYIIVDLQQMTMKIVKFCEPTHKYLGS